MAGYSPSRSGPRVNVRGKRLVCQPRLWANRVDLGNRPLAVLGPFNRNPTFDAVSTESSLRLDSRSPARVALPAPCGSLVGLTHLTFARLRQLREEVTYRKIDEHGGRLIKTTGNGFLAEVASATNALLCAIDLQPNVGARAARARARAHTPGGLIARTKPLVVSPPT